MLTYLMIKSYNSFVTAIKIFFKVFRPDIISCKNNISFSVIYRQQWHVIIKLCSGQRHIQTSAFPRKKAVIVSLVIHINTYISVILGYVYKFIMVIKRMVYYHINIRNTGSVPEYRFPAAA